MICSGIFSRQHDGLDVQRQRIGGLWRPICAGCRKGLASLLPAPGTYLVWPCQCAGCACLGSTVGDRPRICAACRIGRHEGAA